MDQNRKYWALSYGVTPHDLYTSFFAKHSVSITSSDIPHVWYLQMRVQFGYVFSHFIYLIINDVIENLVIFKFPEPRRCFIEMLPITGDDFKRARLNGAFADVDFLASNFTGYSVVFRRMNRYGKWVKVIYVTSKYKNRITELTNKGKCLTGIYLKTLKDYIDAVKKRFPHFTKKDIETILDFGLRLYAFAIQLHCDIVFYKKMNILETMSIINGLLYIDTLKHYNHWIVKWRMKERFLYKCLNTIWDGYYYIGLNERLHLKILKLRGKKKLEKVFFVKVKKELRHDKTIKHIWRVPWPAMNGYKFYLPEYVTDRLEYVGKNNYELYHQCFLGKFK